MTSTTIRSASHRATVSVFDAINDTFDPVGQSLKSFSKTIDMLNIRVDVAHATMQGNKPQMLAKAKKESRTQLALDHARNMHAVYEELQEDEDVAALFGDIMKDFDALDQQQS